MQTPQNEMGARIRELRLANGKSQADLAAAMKPKASTSTISKIECGNAIARHATLRRIADALGAPVETFRQELPPFPIRALVPLTPFDEIMAILRDQGLSRHAIAHIAETIELWKEREGL